MLNLGELARFYQGDQIVSSFFFNFFKIFQEEPQSWFLAAAGMGFPVVALDKNANQAGAFDPIAWDGNRNP
jgi:hypothetical protein